MKKTYTKIFSIALTIALLSGLFLGIVPVAAITQPTVSLAASGTGDTAYQISSNNIYTITFTSGIYSNGTIAVAFPTGTTLPSGLSATVQATAGVTDDLETVTAFGPSSATVTRSGTKATIQLPSPIGIGSIVRIVVGNTTLGVMNPGAPGSYTLTVTTSKELPSTDTETATSAAYTLKAVPIGDLPGTVEAYNSSNQLVYRMNQADSIAEAIEVGGATKIVVGPGTYEITMDIQPKTGQTVVSSEGKANTIIKLTDVFNILLTNSGVTFDGFTVLNTADYDGESNIYINKAATPASTIKVQNCTVGTVTTATGIAIADTNKAPVSITNCTVITTGAATGTVADGIWVGASNTTNAVNIKSVNFSVDTGDAAIDIEDTVAAMVVESCSFSGVAGTGYGIYIDYAAGVTIKNNTFNLLQYGVYVTGATADVTIGDNNTFAGCGTATTGGAVYVPSGGTDAQVKISNNTFSGNVGYSIYIYEADANMSATGNTFTGNAATKGVLVSNGLLNAVMNWWGVAAGPNTTGGEKVTTVVAAGVGTVQVTPWVIATATTFASSVSLAGPAVTILDASATTGVKVTFVDGAAGGTLVIASKYPANPTTVAPPGTAVLGYFDVYTNKIVPNTITLQFYATGISSASNVYYWNALLNKWVLCDTIAISGNGQYVIVTVNAPPFTLLNPMTVPNTGDLGGTIFALVTGIPPAPPTFNVVSPAIGSTTALTNIPFAWAPVNGATSYTFVLSRNANMSSPVVTQVTTGTAYTYTGTLTAGPYYWQVSASEGSKSVTGTFIAAAPPATTATVTSTSTIPAVTTTIAPTTTVHSTIVITTVTTNVTQTTTQTTMPIVITTQPPQTIVITTITQPPVSITYTLPTPTTLTTQIVEFTSESITPAWIYVIIGIGAVLIIVVVVLVIRTRRTV
jgi:hypothetical protein